MKYTLKQKDGTWALFKKINNKQLVCIENNAQLTEDNLDFSNRKRVLIGDTAKLLIGMVERGKPAN